MFCFIICGLVYFGLLLFWDFQKSIETLVVLVQNTPIVPVSSFWLDGMGEFGYSLPLFSGGDNLHPVNEYCLKS